MDWKESLNALRQDLPQVDTPQPPFTPLPEKPKRQKLVFDYERAGRKGKPATIISGFSISDDEIQEIASRLKSALAVGGSARGGEILLQGDHRQRARELLSKWGII